MSILNFFNKPSKDYDAVSEFFITPELHINDNDNGNYSLAIDTGYEDLKRTVKRLNLEGSEVSIKTNTIYVDFMDLYSAVGITEAELDTNNYPLDSLTNSGDEPSLSQEKIKKEGTVNSGKDKKSSKTLDLKNQANIPDNAVLAENLPEAIRLKQDQVIEHGIYYKPLKVVSTLVVQNDTEILEQEIAISYYLAPVSYIDGSYSQLSLVQASHIIETSWSDAYIEAMNAGTPSKVKNSNTKDNHKTAASNHFMKAPLIVALSLSAAFASLYGYNQYQQNNNPLTMAASNGSVDTYMNAKGTNTDEYTQRQLEATKAALSSMGIDVSADADIGCLIE